MQHSLNRERAEALGDFRRSGSTHERAGGAPGQEIVRLGAGQSYDTSAAEEFVRTAIAVALAHGGQQQQGSEHSRDDGEKPRPPILRFLVGRPQEDWWSGFLT